MKHCCFAQIETNVDTEICPINFFVLITVLYIFCVFQDFILG